MGYRANVSVSMLLIKDNKVLLMRRYNTGYEDGKYDFPSGHIEKNESLIDAVIRETFEETGVKVKKQDIEFIECVDNNKIGEHINFLFKTCVFEGVPKIMEENQCDDIMWQDLNEDIKNPTIDVERFLKNYKENIIFKTYS